MDLMTVLLIILAFGIVLVIGGVLYLFYLNRSLKRALWILYLLRLLLQESMLQLRQEQDDYKNFREEVRRKAKQRVVKRAFSAFASLVPGFGLADLVIGMGDILDAANEADNIVADLISVSDTSKTLSDLRENAPTQVIKTLAQEGLDPEALDDTLNLYVKEAVERLENAAESISPAERRKAFEEVVKEFGIEYYDYRKTLKRIIWSTTRVDR